MLRRWLPPDAAPFGAVLLLTGGVHGEPARRSADRRRDRTNTRHDRPVETAAIGPYGEAGQVILWIGRMPNPTAASGMKGFIRTRIIHVDSPFSQVALRPWQAGPIIELVGMGPRHSFYASGSHVIWLGTEPALAEQALVNLKEMHP